MLQEGNHVRPLAASLLDSTILFLHRVLLLVFPCFIWFLLTADWGRPAPTPNLCGDDSTELSTQSSTNIYLDVLPPLAPPEQ